MTIVQPNRQRQLTGILRLLLFTIGTALIILVVFYNQMITSRAAYRSLNSQANQLRLDSAELKNSYYQILENQNLIKAADSLGYIKEQNPKYLRLSAGSQELSINQ